MDSALYSKIYKEGINKQVVIRYIEFTKLFSIYHTTTDYVWRD